MGQKGLLPVFGDTQHGNSEFLKIVASDTAPNPIEKTKQSIGKAGNWLARKSGCGDSGSDQVLY